MIEETSGTFDHQRSKFEVFTDESAHINEFIKDVTKEHANKPNNNCRILSPNALDNPITHENEYKTLEDHKDREDYKDHEELRDTSQKLGTLKKPRKLAEEAGCHDLPLRRREPLGQLRRRQMPTPQEIVTPDISEINRDHGERPRITFTRN